MNIQKLACPHCGAPLSVAEGQTQYTCAYCGSVLSLRRAEAPAKQPRQRSFIWMTLLFFVFTPAWAVVILLDKEQALIAKVIAGILLGFFVIAALIAFAKA